jgi:hypothetical protein
MYSDLAQTHLAELDLDAAVELLEALGAQGGLRAQLPRLYR